MKTKRVRKWDPASFPSYWINHASRLLMRRFEERLRPLDFGVAYLPVAAALDENGPMLQKQLAEVARVEQPTMAALLARMERDGLIVRQPDPRDGRASRVSLSAKGIRRYPKARDALIEIAAAATGGMSKKEVVSLLDLLHRAVANLEGRKSPEDAPARRARRVPFASL